MSAILFLYKEVLGHELEWLQNVARAKRPARMPVVLTGNEARAILARLEGRHWVMASLLYGTGLRLMECVRLRVKDVDFEYAQIMLRDGKGEKDRVTMLPGALTKLVRGHLQKVKEVHEVDLRDGFGEVYLPHALARKYPRAGRESGWQSCFRRPNARSIHDRRWSAAIIPMSKASSAL